MPEVGDPTVRREPPKAGMITGGKARAEGGYDSWGEVVTS